MSLGFHFKCFSKTRERIFKLLQLTSIGIEHAVLLGEYFSHKYRVCLLTLKLQLQRSVVLE